ncbi:MAG: efflux RND transporter periplasmic adaptor subunit [Chloroflexi bacterium]|nr:efflux RND transporter periplasmic adaptor subunit [Chloroflexota bacterium]
MLTLFKTIKLWQALVLLLVAAAGIGGGYLAYAAATNSGQTALAKTQELIPVQLGDLVNQVSTSGGLLFPNKEALTFGAQGTVAEVLVSEGQAIEAGQPLARLDAATIASLEKSAAQARVTLRNSQDALDQARTPHSAQEIALAQAAVANARLSLRNAQDALDTLLDKDSLEHLAEAQAAVDNASLNLASTVLETAITLKDWDKKLAAAEEALAAAEDGYRGVMSKWLGMTLTGEQLATPPETLLVLLGVPLASLYNSQSRFTDIGQWINTQGPPSDDPATPWSEPVVYAWLNYLPAPIVATCEGSFIPPGGVCIMKEMTDAWNAFQIAQDNLASQQNQAVKAVVKGDSSATQARNALAGAQDTLAALKAGADPLELDAKQKQVAVAQANLSKAEEDLADALAGPDLLDLELRQKDVASAQAALDTALERLKGATLTSPLKGIVTLVNIKAGQAVNANAVVVEVADPLVVQMDGTVDEIDVLFIREGAQADVSMDALPGQTLTGKVTYISSAARTAQGVVTYPIQVQLQVPEGVQLREGLSATANIIIRSEQNVLLIPTQAVYGSFQQPTAKVMSNGKIVERPVILGNSDDFWVVVKEGLAQGDRVVMETAQVTTSGQLGNLRGAFTVTGQGGLGGVTGGAGGQGFGGGQRPGGAGDRNQNQNR